MNKNEIAVAITAGWNASEATTISRNDIQELQSKAPSFGVLYEKGGKKLYAFLQDGTIKKKVIARRSGVFDVDKVLPRIQSEGFDLTPLHRV